MILCLDVGNHQIFAGIFIDKKLQFQFRHNSRQGSSSDEIGVFLKTVIRENNFDPKKIKAISLCSVVPSMTHSVASACIKYFDLRPFILKSGVTTGLNLLVDNPAQLGSDRIGNAIGAVHRYPNKNLIICDFGTATTICAVNKKRDYLGGMILAGLKISLEALASKTAQLPLVEIIKPKTILGKNTEENLQSGVFYGNLGAMRELISRSSSEVFMDESPVIIGTGGLARLFLEENLFHEYIPELILEGLNIALNFN